MTSKDTVSYNFPQTIHRIQGSADAQHAWLCRSLSDVAGLFLTLQVCLWRCRSLYAQHVSIGNTHDAGWRRCTASLGARQAEGLSPRSPPRATGAGPQALRIWASPVSHLFLRSDVYFFWDWTSISDFNVRSQNEETSDLKKSGENKVEKGSLKRPISMLDFKSDLSFWETWDFGSDVWTRRW